MQNCAEAGGAFPQSTATDDSTTRRPPGGGQPRRRYFSTKRHRDAESLGRWWFPGLCVSVPLGLCVGTMPHLSRADLPASPANLTRSHETYRALRVFVPSCENLRAAILSK